MKARVLLFLMTAFLLGACSSDDEQIAVTEGSLEGRWIEVYEPHVVSEGIVYYTFHEYSPTSGTCLIDVHDVLSGDYQNEMNYQLLDDGKRIMTGRETDNTDEEISALVSGYWICRDGDEEYSIYSYGLNETVEIMVISKEGRHDEVLTVKETTHEPYEDADTGWYVSLQDEDGASWVMYTEGMQLVIRRTDGSVIRRFDREN